MIVMAIKKGLRPLFDWSHGIRYADEYRKGDAASVKISSTDI